MSDKLINELNRLGAEFKGAIDRADEAATTRLNTAISDLEAKMRANEADANRMDSKAEADAEFKSFRDYLSTRDVKSMSAGSAADGGVTIPKVINSQILAYLHENTVMRQLATTISTTTPDFNYPVQVSGAGAVWTGELTARTTTDTPQIQNVKPPVGELTARALISQQLLEDSQYDLQPWLVNALGEKFEEAQGNAFMTGSGIDQPKGMLTYATSAVTDKAGSRPFGTFQHIASGTAGSLGADQNVKIDKLVDLTMSIKAAMRAGSSFIMTRATLAEYRKMKDSTGQLIWQPALIAGAPSTLLGYPVYEDEGMPEVGANALSVAFGNYKRGYLIVDRVAMTVMLDPYSFDPNIAIKARTRVGGAALDSNAIKFLKNSAS